MECGLELGSGCLDMTLQYKQQKKNRRIGLTNIRTSVFRRVWTKQAADRMGGLEKPCVRVCVQGT